MRVVQIVINVIVHKSAYNANQVITTISVLVKKKIIVSIMTQKVVFVKDAI